MWPRSLCLQRLDTPFWICWRISGRRQNQTFMALLDTDAQFTILPVNEGREHQDSNNKDWEGPKWGRGTNVTLWVGPFGPIQCTVVATSTSEIITRINMLYACTPLFCKRQKECSCSGWIACIKELLKKHKLLSNHVSSSSWVGPDNLNVPFELWVSATDDFDDWSFWQKVLSPGSLCLEASLWFWTDRFLTRLLGTFLSKSSD